MEQLTDILKKLIWSWIKILSEIAPRFSNQLDEFSVQPQELMNDFYQFIALAEHLEMRLSVYPDEPWGRFQWNRDFQFFLSQLIRRTYYCLSHLASLFDNQSLSS